MPAFFVAGFHRLPLLLLLSGKDIIHRLLKFSARLFSLDPIHRPLIISTALIDTLFQLLLLLVTHIEFTCHFRQPLFHCLLTLLCHQLARLGTLFFRQYLLDF